MFSFILFGKLFLIELLSNHEAIIISLFFLRFTVECPRLDTGDPVSIFSLHGFTPFESG